MKKIIFMGTPDFAVPALEKLCESEYDVILVVTQPDKARDRGKKIQFSPVKTKALDNNIPVDQPEKIKNNPEFIEKLKKLEPDLIIVAAYGKILPKELLEIPKFGCINIHGSLLPKYRGAAPIHRAVIEGQDSTGVTIMDMAVELDAGAMLAKASTLIANKTTEALHHELSEMGAELLIKTIPDIFSENVVKIEQDHKEATYAPMVFKEDGHINFKRSCKEIECLVRGMNSWPGTYVKYGDVNMKVWECHIGGEATGEIEGTIINVSPEGIEVAAKDGRIVITKIQMPNKKAMAVSEYLKGNILEKGMVLN